MNSIYKIYHSLPFIMLLHLACCSGLPYQHEEYPQDIPAQITTIFLKNVTPYGTDIIGASRGQNGVPLNDPSSSSDDVFISKLVKSDMMMDLIHMGYTVTQDAAEPHDISMAVFLFYQPDNWPFANRSIHIRVAIYKPDGEALFHVDKGRTNPFGPMGDHLGFASEDMLSDVAKQVTIDLAEQLQKKQ